MQPCQHSFRLDCQVIFYPQTLQKNQPPLPKQEFTRLPHFFFQLRNLLYQKDYIFCTPQSHPQPGDFFEFEGSLKRNPMIETLNSFYEIGELVNSLNDKPNSNAQRGKKAGRQQQGGKTQASSDKKVLREIAELRDNLTKGRNMDLVARNVNGSLSAVITLELGFLNDPGLSDLVDGQFRVLGKVIKTIENNSDSISLLRNTALNKLPNRILGEFSSASDLLKNQSEFKLPSPEWEVKGPAIHILPIAIFA